MNFKKGFIFLILMFIFMNIVSFSDIIELRNLFSFGINLYDYDFSISLLSYNDLMKIVRNNKNEAVQSELLITWLAHQKDNVSFFDKMKNEISHAYLTGEKVANLNFLMFIMNLCDYSLKNNSDKENALNILRDSESLTGMNPNNPWYSIFNSIVYYMLSKDKELSEYQFSFL